MDTNSILKFPDGKGGFIFKRRNPSGGWTQVNEDGNPIPALEKEAPLKEETSFPVKEKRKATTKGKTPESRGVYVHISESASEGLSDFVLWKGFKTHSKVNKGEVIEEALELLFRKYPEFKEYRKQHKE